MTDPTAHTALPDHGEVAGYLVLTLDHGRLKDDWDGEVHPTFEDAQAAIRRCSAAGWTCVLVEARRIEVNPMDGIHESTGATGQATDGVLVAVLASDLDALEEEMAEANHQVATCDQAALRDLLRRLWAELEHEIGCAGLDDDVRASLRDHA